MSVQYYNTFPLYCIGNGMSKWKVKLTEDLMIVFPSLSRDTIKVYLIFPTQKYEHHQGANPNYKSMDRGNSFNVKRRSA